MDVFKLIEWLRSMNPVRRRNFQRLQKIFGISEADLASKSWLDNQARVDEIFRQIAVVTQSYFPGHIRTEPLTEIESRGGVENYGYLMNLYEQAVETARAFGFSTSGTDLALPPKK